MLTLKQYKKALKSNHFYIRDIEPDDLYIDDDGTYGYYGESDDNDYSYTEFQVTKELYDYIMKGEK